MRYLTKLNGYDAVATLRENEVQTILYVEVIMCEEVRNDLADEIITKDDLTYTDYRSRDWSYEEVMEDYGQEYQEYAEDYVVVTQGM